MGGFQYYTTTVQPEEKRTSARAAARQWILRTTRRTALEFPAVPKFCRKSSQLQGIPVLVVCQSLSHRPLNRLGK